MPSIRIIIADDHPIVLDGLEQLFRLEEEFEIVGRCTNGQEALDAVREKKPDVLILDLRMPLKSGLAVLRQLREEEIPTRVVVLTAALDEDEVLEAIRLGVRGVVLKEMAPRLLIQCVKKVHEGGQWLEKDSVGRALDKILRGGGQSSTLTPRELDVVRLVAEGLRNKEIAEKLLITEGTVKIHLHRIYEKLQIGGRVELSVYARDRGLV
ncbi:MAG TPA: response regulator transcription factor [Thermoanaerobaculia bacterium]|nr:response regulator transcription factor [Thermoanaerobaculia bacterium]